MGVENNECVIATTWDDKSISKVRRWIDNLPEQRKKLFVFVPTLANGKTTILLAPDGSKKGFDIANETEKLRDSFVSLLESFAYEDGSNPFDFVEVGYGEFGQTVLRGNCKNMYGDERYAT
jgi:hypothetical protein